MPAGITRVLEHAELANLAGNISSIVGPIVLFDADEYEKAGSDLADSLVK